MTEKQAPSRRDFLKRSGGILAGTTLAANLSFARGAHAAGSDQMKIGLVGCGGRGTGAADNCLAADKNVKLVAVGDAFADRASRSLKQLRKRHADRVEVPDDRVFIGLDAYQKVIDSDVDLVLIVTPPGFRPVQYQAAVEAGKHVFMEKPCCVDAPGYRSLLETNKAADEKNLKVGVGLQRHHQKSYIESIKQIQDGAIGELSFLRVFWNMGGLWSFPRSPEQTEMEYQLRNWLYFVWLSGDHIVEQHVHNLDIGNWIKGAHPVTAAGMGGRQVRRFGPENAYGHIFDHHAVEFTYADGTKMFSQCRQTPGCDPAVAEFAHGTKGVANCGVRIEDAAGERIYRAPRKAPNPYGQEHVDLIRAIRNDEKYNEGHYAADASFTGVLGRMATYSG
ncbi:MAG: Gfo/Idh/MocA family oxidoreductase, partial [Pirellulales bacterium]|nr:Gfo/Idh/MocA family oxidoreductase [Pirellulales bacterium]